MARSTPFARTLPKAEKRRAGRTNVAATPVAIRTRLDLDERTRDEVRRQLARKAGGFALHLERITVRFEDVNGPRGGMDIVCRVEAVPSSLPRVVVEGRAADPRLALRRAADVLARTLARTLDKARFSAPRGAPRQGETMEGDVPPLRVPPRSGDDGSLIGRRVGRAAANLERALDRPEKRRRDAFVDTAAPGTSASDRRAGYGATAARNTKRSTAGMQVALEDSRHAPSRKSTRRSANRAKGATALERAAQLALQTPQARARRERAPRGKRPQP